MNPEPTPLDVEQSVRERYSGAAAEREAALCCPVDYRAEFLAVIPQEILDRDYGCGDPSRHVRSGETVLDLGSGGGKICYIASQVVGATGRVIGVDMNDEMLELAEQYREEIGQRIGFQNVEFHKGKIQDLALDVRALERHLEEQPIRSAADLDRLEHWKAQQRRAHPLIPSDSVDVVVSNCVLNLVRQEDREQLFGEIFRVLRPGGRAVISDIVSDTIVGQQMRDDPTLWSGCISGAFHEDAFARAFGDAGFYGMRVLKRDDAPWQTVQGIEFRSVTIEAFKGQPGSNFEHGRSVIYRGPWSQVLDDAGNTLRRGERVAVSDESYQRFLGEPYASEVIPGGQPGDDAMTEAAATPSCCSPKDSCC